MISGKQFNHKSKSHRLIHGENGWGGRRIALESNFPNLTVVPIQIWPFLDQKEQEKKKKFICGISPPLPASLNNFNNLVLSCSY